MTTTTLYRYECPRCDTVWRGPADNPDPCFCCHQPGNQICRVATAAQWTPPTIGGI